MKTVSLPFQGEVLILDRRHDSVSIQTEHGIWRFTMTSTSGLNVNFAGIMSYQGVAIHPRSSNVVELEAVKL